MNCFIKDSCQQKILLTWGNFFQLKAETPAIFPCGFLPEIFPTTSYNIQQNSAAHCSLFFVFCSAAHQSSVKCLQPFLLWLCSHMNMRSFQSQKPMQQLQEEIVKMTKTRQQIEMVYSFTEILLPAFNNIIFFKFIEFKSVEESCN